VTFQRAVVTFALCVCILFGIALGSFELYQLAHGAHPFSWVPFAFALAAILFPALALQMGSIGTAFQTVAEEIPLLRLGRRATDPVITPAPPPPSLPQTPPE
jgi:TRAP-type C4-dicarboxylate transport system permease small subunit